MIKTKYHAQIQQLHDTGLLEELAKELKDNFFYQFVNAGDDETRLSIGKKVDAVDAMFQEIEFILDPKNGGDTDVH